MITTQQKLLNAAHCRFYNYGIHTTGIDSIIKQAGVAKQSFYNHFPSKQALVLAYLGMRHQQWVDLYKLRLSEATTAQQRVLAVFDAYRDHAEDDYPAGFRGCGLLNAAAEFTADSEERRLIHQQKLQIKNMIFAELILLTDSNSAKANTLAQHFAFLLEGSISLAGLAAETSLITEARKTAQQLMELL